MQASTLGHFMRESSPWTYAIVNLCHVLGIATLFGSLVVLDLRLMGVWRRTPVATITDVAAPVAAFGFSLAIFTGVGLFATKATEYVGNPFLYVKFPAIGLGVINVFVLSRLTAWRERATRELSRSERLQLACAGGLSLACWLTAIAAGRLIAYW
jgi:putative flippase GtrA